MQGESLGNLKHYKDWLVVKLWREYFEISLEEVYGQWKNDDKY